MVFKRCQYDIIRVIIETKGVQHTKAGIKTTSSGQPKITHTHTQSQDKTFTFSAEQLVKFIANVAVQVVQAQVGYANLNQDAIDKKSCLCHTVFEAEKITWVLKSLESACLML